MPTIYTKDKCHVCDKEVNRGGQLESLPPSWMHVEIAIWGKQASIKQEVKRDICPSCGDKVLKALGVKRKRERRRELHPGVSVVLTDKLARGADMEKLAVDVGGMVTQARIASADTHLTERDIRRAVDVIKGHGGRAEVTWLADGQERAAPKAMVASPAELARQTVVERIGEAMADGQEREANRLLAASAQLVEDMRAALRTPEQTATPPSRRGRPRKQGASTWPLRSARNPVTVNCPHGIKEPHEHEEDRRAIYCVGMSYPEKAPTP